MLLFNPSIISNGNFAPFNLPRSDCSIHSLPHTLARQVDLEENNWLRNSQWNGSKENIILIHGYASGDEVLPMIVLRDAYLTHGEFNVFVIDWSALSPAPC